eukprot:s1011_g5.t1
MLSDGLLTVTPAGPPWRKVCIAVFTSLALAAILCWPLPTSPKVAMVAPLQMTGDASDIQAVQRMYDYFLAGKLQGPSCVEAAKEIAIDDVVYDTTSDAMPHISGARLYHGPQGICEFGEFLSSFRQPDYTLVEMLHNGKGTVVIKESLTPTVIATGKTTDHPLENMVEYKVKDGKLSHMKARRTARRKPWFEPVRHFGWAHLIAAEQMERRLNPVKNVHRFASLVHTAQAFWMYSQSAQYFSVQD